MVRKIQYKKTYVTIIYLHGTWDKGKYCNVHKNNEASKSINFLFPLDRMLFHRTVPPSIKFASIHLYYWLERGTVRVKCLAQEHNTVPLGA